MRRKPIFVGSGPGFLALALAVVLALVVGSQGATVLGTSNSVNASGGAYSLKWFAANPATYTKQPPSSLTCPTPSGGTGRAANPLSNASSADTLTSLAPKDLILGQVVPFEMVITVNGNTTPENGAIQFQSAFNTHTTSGDNFGFNPTYQVYCAFVDTADPGTSDPGANAKVSSWNSTVVGSGSTEEIQGTFNISGLDNGDKVVVEIWVVWDSAIPTGASGNVPTRVIAAQTSSGDAINSGNQTVPVQKVQEYFNIPTSTPTSTAVPPTSTSTSTPTSTAVPPTSTSTPTATSTTVPPTSTSTSTPTATVEATSTSTSTPTPTVETTSTSTSTPTPTTEVPPQSTNTSTPTPTSVPPESSATPTPTATSVPPTTTATVAPTTPPGGGDNQAHLCVPDGSGGWTGRSVTKPSAEYDRLVSSGAMEAGTCPAPQPTSPPPPAPTSAPAVAGQAPAPVPAPPAPAPTAVPPEVAPALPAPVPAPPAAPEVVVVPSAPVPLPSQLPNTGEADESGVPMGWIIGGLLLFSTGIVFRGARAPSVAKK